MENAKPLELWNERPTPSEAWEAIKEKIQYYKTAMVRASGTYVKILGNNGKGSVQIAYTYGPLTGSVEWMAANELTSFCL